MTRTARHPLRVQLVAPVKRSAELVWDTSTRAGRALANAHGLGAEPIVAVALVIRQQNRAGRSVIRTEAILRSGERAALGPPRTCRAAWSREHDLEHIDAEGIVHCTLRHDGPTRALFAHSPLLASLGVKPGAYTLRSARVLASK